MLGYKGYNLGAIVARGLHNNSINGDFFGGIYATCLADFHEIPIRGDDIELPPAYLDYNAMVCHQFVERNDQFLQYQLIFDRRRTYHVALSASTFFNFRAKGRYFITREEANEYKRAGEAVRLHERTLQAVAAASQYNLAYSFEYPKGQLWP